MSLIDLEGLNLSDIVDNETEFIPLLSSDEEEQMNAETIPETLPILPLRNTVLFPGVVIPITVSRDKSIKLIKKYYKIDKTIGVVSQKDIEIEDPNFNDLHKIGTVAHIIKLLQMPDGNSTVIIQGKRPFELRELVQVEPYFKASVMPTRQDVSIPKGNKKFDALIASVKDIALQIIKLSPNIPSEASFAINIIFDKS